MEEGKTLHFLAGVTAVGKSELSMQWAENRGAEILSCDSIAIYRGMDLGSAKPSIEQRERVRHHGLDLAAVSEGYDVSRYEKYARKIVEEVGSRHSELLVVGGSGFYLQSFFEPMVDQVSVSQEVKAEVQSVFLNQGIDGLLIRLRELNDGEELGLDEQNPQRLLRALERCLSSGLRLSQLRKEFQALPVPYASFQKRCIWLDRSNEDIEKRIALRAAKMIEEGLIGETEALLKCGLPSNHAACSSVGYREVCSYLQNKISREELIPAICKATRKLVSKQRKWFRKRFPETSHFIIKEGSQLRAADLKWSGGA